MIFIPYCDLKLYYRWSLFDISLHKYPNVSFHSIGEQVTYHILIQRWKVQYCATYIFLVKIGGLFSQKKEYLPIFLKIEYLCLSVFLSGSRMQLYEFFLNSSTFLLTIWMCLKMHYLWIHNFVKFSQYT